MTMPWSTSAGDVGEATLAFTVHVGGRRYRKGVTASQIGADAAIIGGHAWVGGKAPAQAPVHAPDEGVSDGAPAQTPEAAHPDDVTVDAPPAPPDPAETADPKAVDPGPGHAAKKTPGRRSPRSSS